MKHVPNPQVLSLSRRQMLRVGAGVGGAMALGGYAHLTGFAAALQEEDPENDVAMAIVGDVVVFQLEPDDRWEGPFGSVTMQMHHAFFDGGDAWFIRTDASDIEFAEANGLVYAPLIGRALNAEGSFANLYLVADGTEDQRPVISTVPERDDFTPAFRVHNVSFTGEPELLDSVQAVLDAEAAGTVAIEETDIIVNYPLVIWPDGGLAADPDLVEALGPGPLTEEPDLENGTVTFKLHQCYPGSRYIATDTSAVPMAPMMGVVGSGPTQALIDVDATAPIYVFGNGFAGPGPMGFQPSIFNAAAGDPIWSPFWDHFVPVWDDEAEVRVLTSEAEVLEAAEAGELEIFTGTPDTHPDGFVVNCPSPVLAPNPYDPEQFA